MVSGRKAGKAPSMKEKSKDYICFYRPDVSHSLRPDADHGDPDAQAALGRLFFEGRPQHATDTDAGKDLIVSSFTPAFEQDLVQAAKWLQKAADQGHAEAKRLLETVLAEGPGVH
jgi:TPR repeat protein